MTSGELTPTTDDVRDWYSLRYMHEEYESEYRAEFDRWLVSVKVSLLRSLADKYAGLAVTARNDDMPMTALSFQDTAALLSEEASFIERGEA